MPNRAGRAARALVAAAARVCRRFCAATPRSARRGWGAHIADADARRGGAGGSAESSGTDVGGTARHREPSASLAMRVGLQEMLACVPQAEPWVRALPLVEPLGEARPYPTPRTPTTTLSTPPSPHPLQPPCSPPARQTDAFGLHVGLCSPFCYVARCTSRALSTSLEYPRSTSDCGPERAACSGAAALRCAGGYELWSTDGECHACFRRAHGAVSWVSSSAPPARPGPGEAWPLWGCPTVRRLGAAACVCVRVSAVPCSAVQCACQQCRAVQCSAVQCSAVQCSAAQCWSSRGQSVNER
jgi:hypothetical protein